MGKRISQEMINQIPILYKELGTKKAVAEQLGISTATVNKYLNLGEAINCAESTSQKPRIKITSEMVEEINRLYEETHNMSEVARRMGISAGAVKSHLNQENLDYNKRLYEDRDALYFYVYRLFGEYSKECPVDPWNVVQMQKFVKQGMSYRAQLLTLKYFYEVKGNKIQDQYKTIGIIPYIYSESERYYYTQASRAQEIIEAIQKQLEKDRIEIKINPSDYFSRKKKKKEIDLDNLGGD